jgi:sulfur-oxidizing protein SoxX
MKRFISKPAIATACATTCAVLTAIGLSACAYQHTPHAPDSQLAALALLKADFKSKGPATSERLLNQDLPQKLCTQYPKDLPKELEQKIEKEQLASIRYPENGHYLGDFKSGEAIAQNGRGMQSSDKLGENNGGNCYACHQMSKTEISFGNIGPSLYQYGKLRGQSEATLKYTWGKIYNAQAYRACSSMPRFGHSGILQQKQIQDVMALLFDPKSPVNQ